MRPSGIVFDSHHAHPSKPEHIVLETTLKILNGSTPVFHIQASLLCPVKMHRYINVTSDGTALILTPIGDFKCAHTNRPQ